MRHKTPETQRLQISIALRVPRDKTQRPVVTPAFLQEVLDFRLEYGEDPEGVRITGVVWEHGDGGVARSYTEPRDIEAVLEKIAAIRRINPQVFSIGSASLKSKPTAAGPTPTLTPGKRRR